MTSTEHVGDETSSARAPNGRNRALDGLRGAAVVAVLLYHAGHLTGGYLGVDLFFVLSGYLITGLLLTEWAGTGGLRLRNFWARRARRLLPALFVMLLAVAAYAAFVASPSELGGIRADSLATLGYVANWHSILTGHSYWSLFSAPSPLDHTWSLAIEEQFYLVWPLVVLGLSARVGRRDDLAKRVFGVALGGAALLGAWAIALSLAGASSNRIYLGTDTRAPAILLGAALAAAGAARWRVRSRTGRVALEAAAWVGLGWLAWAFTQLDGQSTFLVHGGLLMCGVAAVAVIAAVTHPQRGPAAFALSFRPLCWLGLISYGLYLWHWPVFVWLTPARVGLTGWSLNGVRIAVSLALAIASYFLIEMPIRHGALRGWRIRTLTPAAVGATLTVVLVSTTGAIAASSTVTPSRPSPVVSTHAPTDSPVPPRLLVVGDSVGESLVARLDEVQTQLGVQVIDGSQVGCELANSDYHREPASGDAPTPDPTVTPSMCRGLPLRWRGELALYHPQDVLEVVGFPAVYDIEVNSAWHSACTPWWQQYFQTQESADLALLESTGAHVWIATIAVPGADFYDPSIAPRTQCANRLMTNLARAAHASILDVATHVCPHPSACGTSLDGQELRPDGLHFGDPGGRLFATWVVHKLAAGGSPTAVVSGTAVPTR
jgi:peptidoglycan/LPS O-acetylase OafA/YrhL